MAILGDCKYLWGAFILGSKPSNIHSSNFSFLVWCDVWWHNAWSYFDSLRNLSLLGKALTKHNLGRVLQDKIFVIVDGCVLFLLRVHLQWFHFYPNIFVWSFMLCQRFYYSLISFETWLHLSSWCWSFMVSRKEWINLHEFLEDEDFCNLGSHV